MVVMERNIPESARATPQPPSWRRGVDIVERTAGPPLARVTASAAFAQVVGLALRARAVGEDVVGRETERLLHRLNLPSARDVARLRRLVADVDRQTHQIHRQLGRIEGGAHHGAPSAIDAR